MSKTGTVVIGGYKWRATVRTFADAARNGGYNIGGKWSSPPFPVATATAALVAHLCRKKERWLRWLSKERVKMPPPLRRFYLSSRLLSAKP